MRRRKTKTAESKELGSYLLEFSVAIIGIAVFIVGVADISRMYQARAAVKAGVTAGLRCLYPNDAGCLTGDPANAVINPTRFNAWVWGRDGYQFPRSSVVLNASWFNEPVFEVPLVSRQVSGIDVRRERTPYRNFATLFPIDAHAPYLLKVRDIPRLDGTDPLNPIFLDRVSGQRLPATARGLPGDQVIRLQNVGLNATASTAWVSIGAVSFSVADAWANQAADSSVVSGIEGSYGVTVPCYQGSVLQGPSGASLQWPPTGSPQSCQYRTPTQTLLTNLGVRVPLLFRLTGSRNNVSPGAQGEVRIRMVFTNLRGEQKQIELGGRTFSDSGSVDFLARGASRDDDVSRRLARAYDNAGYEELDKYGSIPMVPLSGNIRLEFFLRKTVGGANQTVGWRGEDLQLFYPKMEFVHEVLDCGYSENPASCSSSVLPVLPLYSDLDVNRPLSAKPRDSKACERFLPVGVQGSYSETLTRLQERFERGELRTPTSFLSVSDNLGDTCTPQISSVACSDEPTQVLQGCEGENVPSNLVSMCDIDRFDSAYDSISDIRFKVDPVDERERRGGCSDEAFPECSRPHQIPQGEQFLGSSGASCSDARRVVAQPFASQPFFNNTCVDIAGRLVEEYRVAHEIPESIDIPIISKVEPAVYSSVPPTDSCQEYGGTGEGDTERLLCAHSSTRGVARRCCERHEDRCILEEVPADPANGTDSTVGGLLASAADRVVETVQIAYPAAQSGAACEARLNNCVQIETALINDRSEAQVRASMSVPLSVLGWLGFSETAVIENEQTRILERSLSAESY